MTASNYGGIPQKWVVVHSRDMQKRKEQTFERNLEKLDLKTRKSLKKLMAVEFACEPDARQAAEQWIAANPEYIFQEFSISTSSRKINSKRGRPKFDEDLKKVHSVVTGIASDEEKIRTEKEKLGRFILATDDRSLEPESMLNFYKQQSHVERMFRFLKDRSFRISEVYLKKPGRIEALSMVMVLTLLVYAVLEYLIRTRMKEQGLFIPNQVRKPTKNPSLKWIFTMFAGVTVVSADIEGTIHRQISHVNESVENIVGILGPGRPDLWNGQVLSATLSGQTHAGSPRTQKRRSGGRWMRRVLETGSDFGLSDLNPPPAPLRHVLQLVYPSYPPAKGGYVNDFTG